MSTWWLSFADDAGCLGVCIVDAPDFLWAVLRTKALGINPGGEVWGNEMPDVEDVRKEISTLGKDRLISVDELRANEYRSIQEYEDEVLSITRDESP